MPGISHYSEEEEMRKERSLVWAVIGLLVVVSLVLASCAPAPAAEPTQPPAQEPTEAPVEATEPPATTEAATEAATEVAAGEDYSPEIVVDEPVTITFASFNDLETPFWQGLREDFQALHPNITVEFQT